MIKINLKDGLSDRITDCIIEHVKKDNYLIRFGVELSTKYPYKIFFGKDYNNKYITYNKSEFRIALRDFFILSEIMEKNND